jgi:Beta-galactosidase
MMNSRNTMQTAPVPRRQGWAAALTVALTALLMAACGGGGGSEPQASDPPAGGSGGGTGGGGDNGPVTTVVRPVSGALFYGYLDATPDPLVLASPLIRGAMYPIYWSEIEPVRGQFDWSVLDARIAEWTAAKKGVAIRILWSSSGYWGDPAAKTPTPQWVIDEGARIAFHADSKTEVPLFWDPIYLLRAKEFLAAFAARYDNHPNVFFVDATPGAETNPFRMGTIDKNDPGFAGVFARTPASDGTVYSSEIWWSTLLDYLDTVRTTFKSLPVLITLNKGGLPDEPTRLQDIGDEAARRGLWVGQNGTQGRSYTTPATTNHWITWGQTTSLFFEQVSAADETTGTLQEMVDACQRVDCDWFNLYARDVLKAMPDSDTFDPGWGAALEDLHSTVGGGPPAGG